MTVRADDITKPSVVAWMTRFQRGVLKAHGYKAGARCSDDKGAPELCPALSLPDLFSSAIGAQGNSVRQLLAAVPPYFSQGVVSRDRKTANMAFGIRLMPLDRQKDVVDDIKRRLDPPKGVQASVVGLPVLAAEANGSLSSPWRRDLTLLAALAAVFLVLLAVRRSRRDAAVPLIPIALATGWSGGLLFILGLLPGPLEVELNPMSVTLSALVIAISTEFSVLLSARYRQERDRGAGAARAIQLTYASTGAAVLASGATAIAGFAALIASDIRMLRDFGIVTVADLTVSLLGVMVVLPAALLWAEEHGPFTLADLDPRPVVRELWARPAAPAAAAAPHAARGRGLMPEREDRFSDLGRDDRSRAEQIGDELAERDRTHPEPDQRPPQVPRPTNRYAWLVGILMLMGVSVLLITTALPNSGEGLFEPAPGKRLPDFAAPLALGHLEGDANICQKRPCPKQSGQGSRLRAQDARGPEQLRARAAPAGADVHLRSRRRLLPAGRSSGADGTRRARGALRDRLLQPKGQGRGPQHREQPGLAGAGGHRQGRPGANRFGVGVCPTTVFAKAGGRVRDSKLGNLTEDELRSEARRLVPRG